MKWAQLNTQDQTALPLSWAQRLVKYNTLTQLTYRIIKRVKVHDCEKKE